MASKILSDPRIDPRVKAMFGAMPDGPPVGDIADRTALLADANTEAYLAGEASLEAMLSLADNEVSAPPSLTGSRNTTSATPWPGRPSLRLRTSRACRPR